jgi:hypothetical protein
MFACCRHIGQRWNSAKYVILGDDVLIGDHNLAQVYLAALRSLGVDVSTSKTYVSTQMCEFAKRYIFRGEEVTPFPVSSVTKNLGDVSLLVSSLSGETRKGLRPLSGIPGAVGTLSRAIGRSWRISRQLTKMAWEVDLGTQFAQGFVEAGEYLLRLNHTLDEASREYLSSMSSGILERSVHKFVLGSLSKSPSSIGLHFLAEVDQATKLSGAFKVPIGLMRLVPQYVILYEFSQASGALYKRGIKLLEGPAGSVLTDILSNILSESLTLDNPKVDARGMRARA